MYGRKMMKGYLVSSNNINVREKVASSLKRVDPDSYEKRRIDPVDKANLVLY